MKYRCKIDTPWMSEGDIITENEVGRAQVLGMAICPSHWPFLFEPIQEETPVEKVAKWLHERMVGVGLLADCSFFHVGERLKGFAQKLIDAGLDVERLK